MASPSIRLLDVEPDIGRFLSDEERAQAQSLVVPVRSVTRRTPDISQGLAQVGAFAGLILEGMVLQELQLGDRVGIHLMGPGDVISHAPNSRPDILSRSQMKAVSPVRIALLGDEVLAAAGRWPRLVAGLSLRLAQQSERVAAQLVICQMPRVEDRLMALLWLLAETWGRVTVHGTVLPVTLTHGTLGGLIGARRPTVTLALGALTERGAIVNQDTGLLLVEGPPESVLVASEIRPPGLSEQRALDNRPARGPVMPADELRQLRSAYSAIKDTVAALHERHVQDAARMHSRLELVRTTRARSRQSRQEIARQRSSRQQLNPVRPPSS